MHLIAFVVLVASAGAFTALWNKRQSALVPVRIKRRR